MNYGPKVEELCRQRKTRSVSVEASEWVCLNCAYYEQHYRQNRGNVYAWVPTSKGYCLLRECERGPLRQPCRGFAKNEPTIGAGK